MRTLKISCPGAGSDVEESPHNSTLNSSSNAQNPSFMIFQSRPLPDFDQNPREIGPMLNRLSPYWIWAMLSILPALWIYDALTSANDRVFHILVGPSGVWSARLLIATLMITPLIMLFKSWHTLRWLKKNRRYFGVAAFAYAALHTIFYLLDKGNVGRVVQELPWFYIWTGWIAFLIFIPLAVTSMDYFVRLMGPRWKTLQRFTYLAAVLTLAHWASLHNWRHPVEAVIHFAPLVALEAYKLWHWAARRRTRAV